MRMNWSRRLFLATGATALGGCAAPTASSRTAENRGTSPTLSHEPPDYATDWSAPVTSPRTASVTGTALVHNLEIPWDLDVTPEGDVFITERVGRIRRFSGDELATVVEPSGVIDAGSVPPDDAEQQWWIRGGEGGVLGIAVHPTYPDPAYLYVYYTAKTWFGLGRENRLVRFDAEADDPASTETVILDGIPASKSHNGGRIAFGPENYLWVMTGDAELGERTRAYAQDLGSLAGKVLRLRVDGRAADGNPDLGPEADPRIYTYGHRNPQGIAWLPDGTVVVTEHGPGGFDEINRLVPGANYGWPDSRRGDEYRDRDDVHPPLLSTRFNTWAPSGAVFYEGNGIPAWRDRLIVGGLVSQQVIVVTLVRAGGRLPPTNAGGAIAHRADWYDNTFVATSHPVLQNELGRVRHVSQAPDGGLYALTSNRDGRASDGFPRAGDDVLVRLEG